MAYKYCVAINTGKNFFTKEDRKNFYLSGHIGDVWVVGDNTFGNEWITKVSGISKTKEEAQGIVNNKIAEEQAIYDALTVEEQLLKNRPVNYNLP